LEASNIFPVPEALASKGVLYKITEVLKEEKKY
jgi:hypothetical protein